ncbi:MAG: hypothetical protein GTO23_10170 [Nitrososphaeria archaeon]|nr:hypothetical protein [Nitrososphaeria archaeon]
MRYPKSIVDTIFSEIEELGGVWKVYEIQIVHHLNLEPEISVKKLSIPIH